MKITHELSASDRRLISEQTYATALLAREARSLVVLVAVVVAVACVYLSTVERQP